MLGFIKYIGWDFWKKNHSK